MVAICFWSSSATKFTFTDTGEEFPVPGYPQIKILAYFLRKVLFAVPGDHSEHTHYLAIDSFVEFIVNEYLEWSVGNNFLKI